jgi:phytol kinase
MSLLLLEVVLGIFMIVVFAEILWRTKILEGELSRKLIHILVGSFAASWGFFLEDTQIYLLAGAMFLVVLLSRLLGVFQSIHSVSRKTWGELFFPLGIAASALLSDSPWVFMAAVLHVGLADGLAAVVGSRYIKKHGYKVFKQQKTVVGTLVFFNASVFIILLTILFAADLQGNVLIILLVPLMATVIENIAHYGADDVLVPVVVTLLLGSL